MDEWEPLCSEAAVSCKLTLASTCRCMDTSVSACLLLERGQPLDLHLCLPSRVRGRRVLILHCSGKSRSDTHHSAFAGGGKESADCAQLALGRTDMVMLMLTLAMDVRTQSRDSRPWCGNGHLYGGQCCLSHPG